MFNLNYVPLGYQQLTSLAAASSLTVPAGANCALISAEVQSARFRDDGVAPTATVGMPIVSGVTAFLYSGTLANMQIIAETSGAIVNVSYYRCAS